MPGQKPAFLLIALFFLHPSLAQYEEKDFVRYTVKEGLSDNYITCLQQDDWGYIWAGTNVGLNRFDGYSFRNFYQGSTGLSLPSSDIRNLKKFGTHQLAIIGGGGFQLLNTKEFSIRNFNIPDSTAFSTLRNAAWDALPLPGRSYAMTTASGFYVLDGSGAVNFRHDEYNINDIGKKRILYGREIFAINDTEYLVYSEESGLAYYNTEKKAYSKIDPSEKDWKRFIGGKSSVSDHLIFKFQVNRDQFIFGYYNKDSILFYDHALKRSVSSPLPFHSSSALSWESKIVMLNDSLFAINDTHYGFYLFQLDKQTGQIRFNRKKFLPSYKITRLFFDRDKRLWAGTNQGLLQQKLYPTFINSYRFPPSAADTLTGGFTCTYQYKNKLYAGRYSISKGLLIIDPSTMKTEKEISFYGNNNNWNEIRSMEMYHKDTIWIGTNAGLLWFDTKTDHYGKVLDEKKYPWAFEFSAILAPPRKDGYAWFCNHLKGMVVRYHIPSREFRIFTSRTVPALPFDRVKSIAYDSYGDVWISGHSLARWNNRLQLFDTLITVYGGTNKFNDDILTLSPDNKGSIWLFNAFNGMLDFSIKEKKFISYSMKDGLPSDIIQASSPVIDNSLWMASNSHLARFNTLTKKIIVYDQHDGLPEHKPTGRRIMFDRESNQLYLCANEYIVKFTAQEDNNPDNSSELIIEELVVNNKNSIVLPADDVRLKYNENNIALNYTIIDYERTNYQFAYKLDNTEDWIPLGTQRNLNLTNLRAGKYHIQLKGIGKSGMEKLKEFILVIQPPFWKTTWFLALIISLITGGLYYLYRTRIKQVRQKANIDKQLSQAEMKALHAQMNPHFIFNSLNSIREMILNNETKEASHFLSKFAQLIRVTLDQSGQSFISLRNTVDYLTRYMEMEQIRNSYFTSRILVDDDLDPDETILPPMLIQPFIENAIWHGTTPSQKNINIKIDFKKENDQLVCIIDDNGIGIDQSLKNKKERVDPHHSLGITNIENRILLLNQKHNMQSSVTIQDKTAIGAETGTLVILRLPLETTKNE